VTLAGVSDWFCIYDGGAAAPASAARSPACRWCLRHLWGSSVWAARRASCRPGERCFHWIVPEYRGGGLSVDTHSRNAGGDPLLQGVELLKRPLRIAGQRPPASARLRLAHPDDDAMIEQLRAIHNGEMPEECDPETGRAYPRPRVWRHEVEWQAVWIIELPA